MSLRALIREKEDSLKLRFQKEMDKSRQIADQYSGGNNKNTNNKKRKRRQSSLEHSAVQSNFNQSADKRFKEDP